MTRLVAAGFAAAALGTMLGACSDDYSARRDTIAPWAGDAIAANAAQQTVDPWPRQSGDTQLAANGQRVQAAFERYRTDKVTPPVDPQAPQTANYAAAQQTQNTGGTLPQSSTTNISVVGSPAPSTSASP
jgi:hypothetical protein